MPLQLSAPADGSPVIITGTLVDPMGNPKVGAMVKMFTIPAGKIGDGDLGVTDNNGQIAFTVSDGTPEVVTYRMIELAEVVYDVQDAVVTYGATVGVFITWPVTMINTVAQTIVFAMNGTTIESYDFLGNVGSNATYPYRIYRSSNEVNILSAWLASPAGVAFTSASESGGHGGPVVVVTFPASLLVNPGANEFSATSPFPFFGGPFDNVTHIMEPSGGFPVYQDVPFTFNDVDGTSNADFTLP